MHIRVDKPKPDVVNKVVVIEASDLEDHGQLWRNFLEMVKEDGVKIPLLKEDDTPIEGEFGVIIHLWGAPLPDGHILSELSEDVLLKRQSIWK